MRDYAFSMEKTYLQGRAANRLGAAGERAAAEAYERRGYRIIIRNFSNQKGKRAGEIDFVAVRGRDIHFVEVKTRTSPAFGFALESVNRPKQLRLLLAIRYFMLIKREYAEHVQHIDVAVVHFAGVDNSCPCVRMYPDVIESKG